MDWSFIDDKACIPMVEFFNQEGLPTKMCCSGHGTINQSLFWISFTDTVTEEDIENFMLTHYTPLHGRIAQRFLVGWKKHWFYCAATIEAANDDLKHLKEKLTYEEYWQKNMQRRKVW